MTSSVHFRASGLLVLAGSLFLLPLVARGDWPTYRADAARSGYSAESLAGELAASWTFDATEPMPAWPRSGRMPFDRAHHCVIAGDQVFFASSADHSLYRLDINTGQGERIFTADGPLRFAPALWRDRLMLCSDDGFLYCLSTGGEVIWKHRGGPGDARRLGNGQLISKWPARGAPAVLGDTVYYAAGIWPTDEIFVYALDCQTGQVRWVNDDSGGIDMPQPHGGADAESGVSAQGYLVVSSGQLGGQLLGQLADQPESDDGDQTDEPVERLLVPTGRAVPAAFDLHSGSLEYFHLQQYGKRGGYATMALGPMFFNSGIAFDIASGQEDQSLGAGPMAAMPAGLVRATEKEVVAYRWVAVEKTDRRGRTSSGWGLKPLWTAPQVDGGTSLIVAGDKVIAGGDGQVTLLDADSGQRLQSLEVEGNVYGLAAAGGRLVASTDTGGVFGFAPATNAPQQPPRHRVELADAAHWAHDDDVSAAVDAILQAGDFQAGYCLDFGSGDGRLAVELARRTEMRIYCVDDDAQRVETLRQRLLDAGLYGRRITVQYMEDLSRLPYPNYFANLVVSGRSLDQPDASLLQAGWQDCLRPYGGQVVFGAGDAMRTIERGPLEKAGQWTHQYMSAANQLCSTDERIEGPLGMLWYRDIDIDVPQRHGRGPSPLFYDGLLYHAGIDEIVCVDAYNGTEQWRYEIPGLLAAYDGDELMGVSGTGSNYCVGPSGLYVRHQGACLRIDRRSGVLLGQFDAPPQSDGQPGTWGYLALEGGTLYGSLANRDHVVTYRWRASTGDMSQQLTESRSLFAMDPESGELRWRYDAQDSIRHNAIAIGDDELFLIDRPLAEFDRSRDGKGEHPPGVLVALDATTGQERWRNKTEIDGTTLMLSPEYQRLVMSYQPTRFSLASEVGGRISVFASDSGSLQWSKDVNYSSRPLINDYTIYAQGGAWDLLSGDQRPFNFSRSYGCGVLAGSRHMMVYRSATLGYFDLLKNERTENYGGMRPGCWINALPAGGLVLVPDASAGCTCSYLNQSWIALEPVGLRPPRIEPPGGAFRQPVKVHLDHDDRDTVLRYTLDGSSPSVESPAYDQPLALTASARVRVRAFDLDGQVSRASDATFRIDPAIVPPDDSTWRIWDTAAKDVKSAPSNWSVDGDLIRQTSNIYTGSASDDDPHVQRYATLRIFEGGREFTDGEVEMEFRSADDDGVGIAFRLQDEGHHYLWATDLQRKYRVLAVKDGDDYRVLAQNDHSYQKNSWQHVRVALEGDRITVYVDGDQDMSVRDETFRRGTIALHCWGSDNVSFRNVVLRPH